MVTLTCTYLRACMHDFIPLIICLSTDSPTWPPSQANIFVHFIPVDHDEENDNDPNVQAELAKNEVCMSVCVCVCVCVSMCVFSCINTMACKIGETHLAG